MKPLRWVRAQPPYGPARLILKLGNAKVGYVSMSLTRGEGFRGSVTLPDCQPFPQTNVDEREEMKAVQEAVLTWIERAGLVIKDDANGE